MSWTDLKFRPSGIPFLLSYVLFPGLDMTLRVAGVDTFGSPIRAWIDFAWLLLFVGACLRLLFHPERLPRLRNVPVWVIVLLVLCAFIALVSPLLKGFTPLPYIMELKPLFYVAVAIAAIAAFGLPTERLIVRAGLFLSGLIAAELLVTSVRAHVVMHPVGSGEVNYDACLIALSFCLALSDPRYNRFTLLCLFFGVLVTFSRTGALATLLIMFFSPRVTRSIKVMAWIPASFAIFLSFQSRALDLALTQVDRYVMWTTALHLITHNSAGLLFGYGVGTKLAADIPAALRDLWNSQVDNLGLNGVFAFQFHAMWLRLLFSWGSIAVVLVTIKLAKWTVQNRVLLARYLSILVVAEGFTMGVFYLSNVAVPFLLLLTLAAHQFRSPTNLNANFALPRKA